MYYELTGERSAVRWPDSEDFFGGIDEAGQRQRIPILQDNTLLSGLPGTGKTETLFQIVDALQNSEVEKRLFVFFDSKKEFQRRYYRPGDKIISFRDNPAIRPEDNFHWNMISEIRKSKDPRSERKEIAAAVFADLMEDPRNRIFSSSARDSFDKHLGIIVDCYTNSPANRTVIGSARNMPAPSFLNHLCQDKDNVGFVRNAFDYDPSHSEGYTMPRKASDIMFFLSEALNIFDGNFLSRDGKDTIADFLSGKYGQNLFIEFDYSKRESIRLFASYFLSKIISEKLSIDTDKTLEVKLVLDEIAELSIDFGLLSAATLGRANGIQIILAIQSLQKLYTVAPEKHADPLTTASLAGFPSLFIFRQGEEQSIRILQDLCGYTTKVKTVIPLSRYQPAMTEIITEPILTSDKIASLGIGEAYIKLRNLEPQRIKILRKEETI